MKTAIVFLETYYAAGSDKVSKIIFENLEFSDIHIFVNKSYDPRILELDNITNNNIKVHYYSLFTTSQ